MNECQGNEIHESPICIRCAHFGGAYIDMVLLGGEPRVFAGFSPKRAVELSSWEEAEPAGCSANQRSLSALSTQATLFDSPVAAEERQESLKAGRSLRDEGLARVLNHGADEVLVARRWALFVAHYRGRVASDTVREFHELPSRLHPNTYGAIFTDKRLFKKVGVRQSTTASRRAGLLAEYELTEYGKVLAAQIVREVEQKAGQGA